VILVPVACIWRKHFVCERPARFLEHFMLFGQLCEMSNIPNNQTQNYKQRVQRQWLSYTEQSCTRVVILEKEMTLELWTTC
jgi:hypothetical protein